MTSARFGVALFSGLLMIQDKLDGLATRKRGDASACVVGASNYQKFLEVMDGCTRVNLARRRR
jgi:hypothetical protein